jgi:hypothetical protein
MIDTKMKERIAKKKELKLTLLRPKNQSFTKHLAQKMQEFII